MGKGLCKVMGVLNLVAVAAMLPVAIYTVFNLPYLVLMIWCVINAGGWFRLLTALEREGPVEEEVPPEGMYYPQQHEALLAMEQSSTLSPDQVRDLRDIQQELEQTRDRLQEDLITAETLEGRGMVQQMIRENAQLLSRAGRLTRKPTTAGNA